MPKRTDIHKILIIGAGPIVIGQACEFDYSGTQACKALKEEGYQVVLVNSNPATIMTDPEMAHRTYIEPMTPDMVTMIIEMERMHSDADPGTRGKAIALLPTMGGQVALDLAVTLTERGVLKRLNVELIGAGYEAIKRAEDRHAFKQVVEGAGLQSAKSEIARNMDEAWFIANEIGFPVVVRPSFTLGGSGGSIAQNPQTLKRCVQIGLQASPIHEVLIEESLLGWKEFELEVMRDHHDNVVVICSVENLDPVGVHTGDSITVAPAQTLTDREYQAMRNAAIRIIRGVGVDTGGSNIQFAICPRTGQMRVIEMNPRVSRSSALASKATGYPIAKIAAKLAVGYTLDELPNDLTRMTKASFEPTLDYVVVKIPRFPFGQFPDMDAILTLQMKSVGEVMAIGRTFKEAFMKAIRSLEVGRCRSAPVGGLAETDPMPVSILHAVSKIHDFTKFDPWFCHQIEQLRQMEQMLQGFTLETLTDAILLAAKSYGFPDDWIGSYLGACEEDVAKRRRAAQIEPVYKRIDTCGAEFEVYTPYLYSTYEGGHRPPSPFIRGECEADPTDRKKVIILGSGPNRIGQGIEFDYSCVHAAMALRSMGYESIMMNCNPETVSTDYDTSDRLYFEPLTFEDVLHVVRREEPMGVVVQFGGQMPLKLALPLMRAGVPILGTSPDEIDRTEERERFSMLLDDIGLKQPAHEVLRATDKKEIEALVQKIGYPLMIRPSYVLGGRGMHVTYDASSLWDDIRVAGEVSSEHPIYVDKYLEDATEVDVDAVSDGYDVFIGGIMEHIEEAGVHSGDSACALPAFSLRPALLKAIEDQTIQLARALKVVGLMNIQFAVKEDTVYVLEVNPRASRTVPFVSKTIGVPLAQIAMKVMMGARLHDLDLRRKTPSTRIAIKEAVFPFRRLNVDSILGPQMKSTGEVMGIATDFGMAFVKAQEAARNPLPTSGCVFISVKDKDKPAAAAIARALSEMGFSLLATSGTAEYLRRCGQTVESIAKVKEGSPHIVDRLKEGTIDLVINSVGDRTSQEDSRSIRQMVLEIGIPYFTTVAGAKAAVAGIKSRRSEPMRPIPL